MARKPVLIDCDPGVDDAAALVYAAAHLDIIGVTTVSGNVSAAQGARNALTVLDVIERDIPVAAGLTRPWVGPPIHAKDVHGPSGLDGGRWPAPRRQPIDVHAVTWIIEQARTNPGLTVVALGPLSNIATALRIEPRLAQWIEGVYIMGGSTTHGNITPTAEFNIYADPEAAYAVLTSDMDIHMTGLNVTERVRVEDHHIERLRQGGARLARLMADLLEAHNQRMIKQFGLRSAVLHDPCALAPLIRPGAIQYAPARVDVELGSSLTRGMTVCDLRTEIPGDQSDHANLHIAVDIDVADFMDHLIETILSFP